MCFVTLVLHLLRYLVPIKILPRASPLPLPATADNINIVEDIRPLLSPQAFIILPGGTTLASLTSRWREFKAPSISVVVRVAVEQTSSKLLGMRQSTASLLLLESEATAQPKL
ncbi:hypothetical protein GGS26DRAFT_591969 [Hypomontagnella submonticulosa]|nr:hypothetical protein GGS26DRAFT_591969 [Hypomontagnella submonticulosa]